ncbi:hypothetical protein Btru_047566 [Bulinus truncatus]|nr:hypothetical protein Btru_047566 [Bulinus truncatus]
MFAIKSFVISVVLHCCLFYTAIIFCHGDLAQVYLGDTILTDNDQSTCKILPVNYVFIDINGRFEHLSWIRVVFQNRVGPVLESKFVINGSYCRAMRHFPIDSFTWDIYCDIGELVDKFRIQWSLDLVVICSLNINGGKLLC